MNMNDDELQRNAESGHDSDDIDAKAYRLVFDALRKEPEINLSPSFADKVVAKVEAKKKGFLSSEFFWFGVGIFSLLIAFTVAVVMTDFKLNFGFLSGMSSYFGLFVFGTVFIGLLNLVDKKIFRKQSSTDI